MPNKRKRLNYFLISGMIFIFVFGSLFWLLRQETSAAPLTASSSSTPPTFDLQITKSVTPTYGPPGSIVTYTITISNNGPNAASDLIISDTLPTAVILSHVNTGGDFFTQTITPTLSWSYLSLNPGEQDSITITGIISAALVNGPVLTNTAVITQSPNTPLPVLMAGGFCPTNEIIINGSELAFFGNIHSNGDVLVTGGGMANVISGFVTYNTGTNLPNVNTILTPTTNNPSQAPPRNYPINIQYADFLPNGWAYEAIMAHNLAHYHFYSGQITKSVLQNQGWLNGSIIDEGVYVSPTGFNFAAGSATGLIADNVAMISLGKIEINGNQFSMSPYFITQIVGEYLPGDISLFTEGFGDPCANNKSIVISGSDTNLGGIIFAPYGRIGLLTSGNLGFNGSFLAGEIDISGSTGIFASNQLTNPVDANPSNNTAETPFYVTPFSTYDLEITKSVTPTTGPPGTAVTYTITISNNGPRMVTDLLITDTLPAELIVTHIETGNYLFTQTITPTLSWSYPSLFPGDQASITMTGIISPSVITGTTITNSAAINQSPKVPLPALMAGGACPGPSLAIGGSQGMITGNLHSNGDIYITSSPQSITGFVTYGISTNLPDPDVTITPTINNPAQVPFRDYPVYLQYADFVPNGWAYEAIMATNPAHYHYYFGEINLSVLLSQGWLNGSVLETGVYVTPNGFNFTGVSGLIADQATFISNYGDIDLSGNNNVFGPYFAKMLFFTEFSGNPCDNNSAIDIATTQGNFSGILFAPYGKIRVASSTNSTFTGSTIGGNISVSGSGLNFMSDPTYIYNTFETDPFNNTAEAIFTLTLPIPTADPGGPYIVDEGSTVQLDASGSTGLNLSSYDWDLDNDGLYDDASGITVTFGNTADNALFPIGLQVSNSYGFTDTAVTTITVNNVAPILTNLATTAPITESEFITLTGSIIDPGSQDTFTLTVEFGDGALAVIGYPANITAFTLTNPYLDDPPGPSEVYTISLEIEDKDGGSSTAEIPIQVLNAPPIVDAGPDQKTFVHKSIIVNGAFTDLGPLDTHTFVWDFGDGTIITGSLTANHAFDNSGTYTVTLTVIDDDGGVGFDTLVVVVNSYLIYMPVAVHQTTSAVAAVSNSAVLPPASTPHSTVAAIKPFPQKVMVKPKMFAVIL